MLDFVLYAYENYHLQTFLEEFKYKQQQQQQQQQKNKNTSKNIKVTNSHSKYSNHQDTKF